MTQVKSVPIYATKTAWKFTVELDKQRQLFYGEYATDYLVDTFVCFCGNSEFVIRDREDIIEHHCSVCANDQFCDANQAWENFDTFIKSRDLSNFSFEYHILKKEKTIGIGYAIVLPESIDFIGNRVVFGGKDICQISINASGDISKEYETEIDRTIFGDMTRKLARYITLFRYFDIPYDKNKIGTLTQISFFLRNKHLKSADYFYWKEQDVFLENKDTHFDLAKGLAKISNHRKEKSVKKAVYTEYLRQMEEDRSFHPGDIYILSKTIADPNILIRFLSPGCLGSLGLRWEKTEVILLFLKHYYSEKQILKLFLFKRENDDKYLFYDVVNMLSEHTDTIRDFFRPVRCTVRALHDEFVRCLHQKDIDEMPEEFFEYTHKELKKCIKIGRYTVHLPRSGTELFNWGRSLKNCLSGYGSRIRSKDTLVYGFFSGYELMFAAEIEYNKIIQASGRCNRVLEWQEDFALCEWHKKWKDEIT